MEDVVKVEKVEDLVKEEKSEEMVREEKVKDLVKEEKLEDMTKKEKVEDVIKEENVKKKKRWKTRWQKKCRRRGKWAWTVETHTIFKNDISTQVY